jgi:hypothetical protein
VRDVTINGRAFRAFDFRPEQYASVLALTKLLVRLFPAIKPEFPEDNGKPLLQSLAAPEKFFGVVGHLHVDKDRRKWDPGAFDWTRLKSVLRGFRFPVSVRGYADVPEEPELVRRAALAYFRNAEERASGFFPVAPGTLWHSGVHLRAIAGDPVYAPMRGRLVAARVGRHQGSSTSFVLIRHDLEVAGSPLRSYTLLAHLGLEAGPGRAAVPWLAELQRSAGPEVKAALGRGQVLLLDVPVEAGDVVGTVDWVRRGPEWGPEVHVEAFTVERPPDAVARSFRFVTAAADGLVAARAGLLESLDENRDQRVTTQELRRFFREGDPLRRQAFRHLAVRHVHEWGDRLANPAEAAPLFTDPAARAEMDRLWKATHAPYVFWTKALADHAGLPANQTVYSYNPIVFLLAVSSASRGTALRWPPRATIEVDEGRPEAPRLADWATPPDVTQESQPIFGPLIGAESRIRKKSEIPLIVLPR